MEKRLQQRLIGAAVIIALAVIFLPMLLNGSGSNERVSMKMQIPPEPSYSFNGAAQPPAASGTAPVQPISVAPASSADSQQPAPAPAQAPQSASASTAQQATPAPASQPSPQMVEPKVTAPAEPVQQQPAPAKPAPSQSATPQPASTPAQNEASTGGQPVTPAWVVQVASLSKESGARDLRDRLRKQGFSAYVDRFDDKGKVYYRVRVGPKLTRAGAEAQQTKILKATKLKGIVVPYK
ncbi:SPOR domain-containing protein [Acidihalobacter prosperus]